MNLQANKHEFALYYPQLSASLEHLSAHAQVTITDQTVIHRIATVLRLRAQDSIVLFDSHMHATCVIDSISKKALSLIITTKAENKKIAPEVVFLLPLLKKEALETALYSLVETGVTTIQLVKTEKVQRKWVAAELDRLQKIIIAACEQSKQFVVPQLLESVEFSKIVGSYANAHCLYADPHGEHMKEVLQKCTPAKTYVLMVGPEGDLTAAEKELLLKNNFLFCALTPTILRSVTAVGLFAGIIRTYCSE